MTNKRKGRCLTKQFAVLLLIFISVTCTLMLWSIPETDSGGHICQTFNGRLGNHIWQYASIYGIAKLHDFKIILGENDDIVKFFKLPSAEIRKNRNICQSFISINAPRCCTFEPSLMNLTKNKSYILGEYLQSWRYFYHVLDDVRKELTFNAEIQQMATYIVENYRQANVYKTSESTTMVGIHIRRGDKAHLKIVVDDGVMVPPDEFYHRAMDYFIGRYHNVVFIVCSDDMPYSKRVIEAKNATAHFVHLEPIQDLAILSVCDHVLMSVGSFGWWAGIISKGTVVYYKYPTKEGSHAHIEYTYADFFPPEWIPIG